MNLGSRHGTSLLSSKSQMALVVLVLLKPKCINESLSDCTLALCPLFLFRPLLGSIALSKVEKQLVRYYVRNVRKGMRAVT
jgi:hypothetical protein